MSLGDSKEPGPCLLETVFIEGNAIPRSLGACLLDASANRYLMKPNDNSQKPGHLFEGCYFRQVLIKC